jgi:Uma2 family endonuclease
MMAAPTSRHQEIQTALIVQLAVFLQGKPCQVYASPFGVRLHKNKDTAYEPDIVVLCDHSKRKDRGCEGAPDMIIEIISPSTEMNDRVLKYNEYMQAGVREYWIVDPIHNQVTANRLIEYKFNTTIYLEQDIAPVQVLQGCEIDLSLVFKDISKGF